MALGLAGQSKAQRIAAVDALLESGSPNLGYALLDYGRADRYQTGRDQQLVAGSMQAAYAAGELTDGELEELASTLSPAEASDLSAMLAADPRAAKDDGLVEAWGELTRDLASSTTDAADRAAYEQASAIAFSASSELIEEQAPHDHPSARGRAGGPRDLPRRSRRSGRGLGRPGRRGQRSAEPIRERVRRSVAPLGER